MPTVVNSSLALVSNHLSYLDILVYSAIQPSIMVAKKEVRSWPLIGWITAQAGTVYVERADHKGGRTQTHAEVNQQMAEAFKSQLPVLFYPEGTTTDGAHVLAFRRGLFHSILKDQVALKTSAIAYSLDVFNPDATLEQDVCYWGDMEFMPHLFRCLGLQGMHAHVVFSPHTVAGQERFSLAANAREAVLELYQGIAETALEPVLSHARTRNDSSDDPYGLSEHWPDGLVTVEHTPQLKSTAATRPDPNASLCTQQPIPLTVPESSAAILLD